MEESLKELRAFFGLPEKEAAEYPPLTLAYIGDAVFELAVRYIIVSRMNVPVNRLHKASSRIVCAGAQSEMAAALEGEWTEEEEKIFRRGRNAKSNTAAKNASITEYRRATGFEAVIGYLFLKGDHARVTELCEKAIASTGQMGDLLK